MLLLLSESNNCIPYKYCENGLLVVPENGNFLNKLKEFCFHYANKLANVFYYNFHCPQSIIHIYRFRKRMVFRTMTFRFAIEKGKPGAYKETATGFIFSLLSTTVAANQTKWSCICFCGDSLSNRWVPSNSDSNEYHALAMCCKRTKWSFFFSENRLFIYCDDSA